MVHASERGVCLGRVDLPCALTKKKGTRTTNNDHFPSPSTIVPFNNCPAFASSLSLSLSDPDWKAIHYTSFPCPNDSSHPRAELTIRHQITRSRYMEQPHPLLASSSKSTTTPFYLALDQRAASASSPPADEVPTPPPTASDPFKQSSNEGGSEIIKAKIMSHPLYPALLKAFIDCRKVRTN
jgi:hypothetical protein